MTPIALTLFTMLQTASGTPAGVVVGTTIPTVSADVDGVRRPLDTFAVVEDDGTVEVLATSPSKTVTFRPTLPPGVPTSAPAVSFDQKLTLQDPRTKQLTVYDQYVIHRTIRSEPVPFATPPRGAHAAASDAIDDMPIDKRPSGTATAGDDQTRADDPFQDRPTNKR